MNSRTTALYELRGARLIHRIKLIDQAGGIEERMIWEVPKSAKSLDRVRYRLAYIPHGAKSPAILYDNHYPKGHHKHIQGHELPYEFSGVEKLLDDFGRDVEGLRWKH